MKFFHLVRLLDDVPKLMKDDIAATQCIGPAGLDRRKLIEKK